MTVSATQDASDAATAASAAVPPSSRISTPASTVAGCPAATPAGITAATLRPTAASVARVLPCAALWDCGVVYGGQFDAHQGREAAGRRAARPPRRGYGLGSGSDR